MIGLIQLEMNGFFAIAKSDRAAVMLAADGYPHVQAIALLRGRRDATQYFEQALDLIILGIERIAQGERDGGSANAKSLHLRAVPAPTR